MRKPVLIALIAIPLSVCSEPLQVTCPALDSYSKINSSNSDNYVDFLIIGDWGKEVSGQILVANAMQYWADKNEGANPQFVVSIGDNFYKNSKNEMDRNENAYDGVLSITDVKFNSTWKSVYGKGKLGILPWYSVLGNHDWLGNPDAQADFSKVDEKWFVDPNFFYVKTMSVGDNKIAALVFIETDLLAYGYKGEKGTTMSENFIKKGWISGSGAIEQQLNWIKQTLGNLQNTDYILVFGHHPTSLCQLKQDDVSKNLYSLNYIFSSNSITSYIHGHEHASAFQNIGGVNHILTGNGARVENPGVWTCSGGATFQVSDSHFGFARGIFSNDGFGVEFRDDQNKMIFKTPSFLPRLRSTPVCTSQVLPIVEIKHLIFSILMFLVLLL